MRPKGANTVIKKELDKQVPIEADLQIALSFGMKGEPAVPSYDNPRQ
jgi:hypothetical protein